MNFQIDELTLHRPLLFDGAMGTQLIEAGLTSGAAPEAWNLSKPETIARVHSAYQEAGADVITTNTFGASPLKLKTSGLDMGDVNRAGVEVAIEQRIAGRFIAGNIGPSGMMLPPMGQAQPADLEQNFAQQAAILDTAGVDLFLIETMYDLREAVAAVRGIRSVSTRPVGCTLTFNRTKRGFFTLVGDRVDQVVDGLVETGVSFLGANCTLASADMGELAQKFCEISPVPVLIQANAGQPQITSKGIGYPEGPQEFADNIARMIDAGVKAVGGCCGTTPAHIKRIREYIDLASQNTH